MSDPKSQDPEVAATSAPAGSRFWYDSSTDGPITDFKIIPKSKRAKARTKKAWKSRYGVARSPKL
jgi:hypothetical protein